MKLKNLIPWLTILIISCMNESVRYEYADGNANIYLLSETELRFVPVKPAESSTGLYSGGEPRNVTVTKAQFQELKELFDSALDNSASHIKDRMKTSGLISMIGSSSKEQCIIKPGCAEMIEIEKTLKRMLP